VSRGKPGVFILKEQFNKSPPLYSLVSLVISAWQKEKSQI
jgi:hypothetical protein